MSTSIDQSFITDYEARVKEAYQRMGAYLRPGVRLRTGVIGSTAVFHKHGTGEATTKARHGTITPMNAAHSTATATLADFYAGDWYDKLDLAKTNINERQLIANAGAAALGRKVDSQITTALDSTTQPVVSWTVTAAASVRNALLNMVEALQANDVPMDGRIYGALTTKAWAHAMTVREFSSADWVGTDGLPFKGSAPTMDRWKDWMGVKWKVHSGLPGKGTATAKVFVWHQDAVGYAVAEAAGNLAGNDSVAADITWHGDRAAWFVNHLMSGGAVLIEDAGVIEGNLDDTAAIATS